MVEIVVEEETAEDEEGAEARACRPAWYNNYCRDEKKKKKKKDGRRLSKRTSALNR